MYRYQRKNWLQKQQMMEEEERTKKNGQGEEKIDNSVLENLKKQYEERNNHLPKLVNPTPYHIQQSFYKNPQLFAPDSFTNHSGVEKMGKKNFNPGNFEGQKSLEEEDLSSDVFSQDLISQEMSHGDEFDLEYDEDQDVEFDGEQPISPSSEDISINFLNFETPMQEIKFDERTSFAEQINVKSSYNSSDHSFQPFSSTQSFQNLDTQNPINSNTLLKNTMTSSSSTTSSAANLNPFITSTVSNSTFTSVLPFQSPSNGNSPFKAQINFNPSTSISKFRVSTKSSISKPETEKPEEVVSEKLRRRRESHNAVERRRRDQINERITELSFLVPDCLDSNGVTKPNKGFILRKSAEYIRFLQDMNRKLEQVVNQQQQILHNPNEN